MADYLRSNYGLAQAVYLTRVAWQLSKSFASTEQLQQQWQQATETEVTEPDMFIQINTHALMAQALIQYTNGMTLNRWRQVDIPLTPNFPAVDTSLSAAETFAMWVNLKYFWQQILTQHDPTVLSAWLTWLSVTDQPAATQTPTSIESLSLVLNALQQGLDVKTINALDDQTNHFSDIDVALIRQWQHQQNHQLLAFAYDWIEVYQLLELSPSLLTAEQQNQLARVIETATSFWLDAEAEIQAIDQHIHALIAQLLNELPNKFKNPDHQNDALNQQIFSLITGINNPNSYFSHPLRQDIQENLEVCLNLSVRQRPEPPQPIANNQFDSCFNDFIMWGTAFAQSASMAGNLIKLDNTNSLNRALELPSVQIINNLNMQAANELECQQQLTTQANLVEWLFAAETLAWFHDRWPGLMAANQSSEQINRLVDVGMNLHQYPDCLVENNPLQQQFSLLQTKWERLKQEMTAQIKDYTQTQLSPNNDVDLFKSSDQQTNYVPDEFMVEPCDVKQSCGTFVTLEPSTELLNLFPNHLKLAEQFGLGQLDICYDQVEWHNRKAVATHLDNNKIANFEGQLAIRLNGMYQDKKVFSKTLISEQRHVYLFGENNQATLDLACPLPLVGKQINTKLDRGTFGLLPNRLTFLTAQKVDINAVLRNNWSQWQSSIGDQGFSYFDEMNAVKTSLSDAFLQHVNDLQQQIYRKLITNNQSRTNDSALSKAVFDYLTQRQLISHMATGLYPQKYAGHAGIRAALSGDEELVDMAFFRAAYHNQTNIIQMMQNGDENISKHQSAWQHADQPGQLIYSTINQLQQLLEVDDVSPTTVPN